MKYESREILNTPGKRKATEREQKIRGPNEISERPLCMQVQNSIQTDDTL